MTLEELRDVVLSLHMPKFTALQIAEWIYKHRVSDFAEMINISADNKRKLEEGYIIGRYRPSFNAVSRDGTEKYLFRLPDGNNIESVYIPDKERATLCVSSQAGCRMNCRFCVTGRNGYHDNITSRDIINQVLSVPHSRKLTNIVFMGMGEPLDNIEEVLKSIEILTSKWGMAWSPRRITVSSIGKTDNLKLLLEKTEVHVAISLHTPFSEERRKLMPVEKAYPITDVIDLLRTYDFTKQRRCSFEYIMFKGLNDDLYHARELIKILKPIKGARVNLIRFHAFKEEPELKPSTMETMEKFRDYLNNYGITATIRASRGEDIMAACGMLAGKAENS